MDKPNHLPPGLESSEIEDDLEGHHSATITVRIDTCFGYEEVTIGVPFDKPHLLADGLMSAVKGIAQARGTETLLAVDRELHAYSKGES